MRNSSVSLLVVSMAALLGSASAALADSAAASCEVRKEGETRKGALSRGTIGAFSHHDFIKSNGLPPI